MTRALTLSFREVFDGGGMEMASLSDGLIWFCVASFLWQHLPGCLVGADMIWPTLRHYGVYVRELRLVLELDPVSGGC